MNKLLLLTFLIAGCATDVNVTPVDRLNERARDTGALVLKDIEYNIVLDKETNKPSVCISVPDYEVLAINQASILEKFQEWQAVIRFTEAQLDLTTEAKK